MMQYMIIISALYVCYAKCLYGLIYYLVATLLIKNNIKNLEGKFIF